MRQFKLWFCSLLLLVANVANSQTSESTTPDVEELTDGILAFTCEGTDEEFPAIFINDNSKWTMVDDTDFDLITEIDNGFKIQSSKFPDMLAYFQDTGSYWEYNELSEDGPSKTICREEDEFLELVVDAISPKLLENGNSLEEKIEMLELLVKQLGQNQQEDVDTATPLPEPTVYYELEGSLTTNLKASRRFLQIGLGISTDNGQEVIKNIETHLTTLKSDILAALSEYTEEMVVGREARKLLADDIKSVINNRLKMLGYIGEVGEVLFTSYVMQ
jgi:flagellar basal body-associated protein FliL